MVQHNHRQVSFLAALYLRTVSTLDAANPEKEFIGFTSSIVIIKRNVSYTILKSKIGLGGKIRTYELLLPKQAEWAGLSDTELISKILYILIIAQSQ